MASFSNFKSTLISASTAAAGIELGGGGGISGYNTIAEMPLVDNALGDTAFAAENNRLYVWNGSGWYSVGLINTAPSITTGGAGIYALAQDGTPTVITLDAEDPEGLPITWSYSVTTGSLGNIAAVSQVDNVFTITPSTQDTDVGEFTITFTASDGVNIATDVNSFSLSFLSPLWDDTLLSIGTSSTNGLNNSTFIDRSTNDHAITPSGTPTQSSFHPYLDNWSVEFNGTSDYVRADNALSTLTSASDPWTIEMWFWSDGNDFTGPAIPIGINASNNGDNVLLYRGGSVILGATTYDFSSTMPQYQWVHIAMTYDGTTLKAYHDGTEVSSDTVTFLTAFSNCVLGIATEFDGANGGNAGNFTKGWMSNFRVSNNVRYTSSFTPSTSKLSSDANTLFLGLQSNRFIDESSANVTVTPYSSPEISAFNPFGQESEYAPGENKGSGYFVRASSQRIAGPDAILPGGGGGTGSDFTLEGWVYPNNVGSNQTVAAQATGATGDNGRSSISLVHSGQYLGTGIGESFGMNSNGVATFKYYAWNHFVWQRSGSTYSLYLNGERVAQTTNTNKAIDGGQFRIGTMWDGDGTGLNPTDGYISDIRVTYSAVYDGGTSITVPTSAVGGSSAEFYVPFDNAGVFDKTGNQTLTLSGDPITKTSVKKYDNSSIELDNNDAIVVLQPSTMHRSVPGDFTFETWIKLNAQSDAYKYVFMFRNTSDLTKCLDIRFGNGGFGYHLQFTRNLTGGTSAVYSINKVQSDFTGDFHHVAWTRTSGVNRVFFDGTQMNVGTGANPSSFPSSSWTDSTNILLPNSYILLGNVLQGNMEGTQWFNGYSKYTSSFTPPTKPQGRTYQAES